MATEVYGEPGNPTKSPPFQITGIGGNLSATVNKQTGVTQIYKASNTQQSLGAYDPKTKKFTADSKANLTAAEKSALSSTSGTQKIAAAGTQTATKGGATNASSLLNPTSAPNNNPSNTGDGTNQQGAKSSPEDQTKAREENEYKDGTRTSYSDDLKYPLNLKSELQDVIRFSILQYSPSLAKENQSQGGNGSFGSTKKRVVTLDSGIPVVSGSKRIGVITLPVPSGISDGNTVSWQDDTLSMVGQELGNFAKAFEEGVGGAEKSGTNTSEKLAAGAKTGDAATAIKGVFTNMVANGGNFAGRAYGAAFNNNLELLFSGPGLRTFSFQFSFYPRDKDEAIMVRKIIRAFKQSMSVKRSKTSLLLKAPHTFAISYVTAGGKAHPYLNRFKECALTSCSVDYTPDGTYMTYGGEEKSMTAYRMSLSFQELEPIFDDEYGQDDSNIGF